MKIKGIKVGSSLLQSWNAEETIGYYWLSESQDPVLLLKEQSISLVTLIDSKQFQFVLEGMFYSKTGNKSLVLKTFDAELLVFEVDWNQVTDLILESETVPCLRSPKNCHLKYQHMYQMQSHPIRPKMKEKVFLASALVGFEFPHTLNS